MKSWRLAAQTLLLAWVPAIAFAGSAQRVARELAGGGYDPVGMQREGLMACAEASDQIALGAARQGAIQVSAWVKRDDLVYSAIGFAEQFARRRNLMKIRADAGVAHNGCNSVGVADCTRTDQLIRRLARLGPDDDWCAAFIATLSNMVDDEFKGGPHNLLHSGSSASAANYASVAKLLAIFDPAVPLSTIDWNGHPPKKHPESFLPAYDPPVPGCMAVYKDRDAPRGMVRGHVALVVAVSNQPGSKTLQTVEGNTTPVPGMSVRGVFAKIENRPWGQGAALVDPGDGHHLVYQGCVLPWPGDSVVFSADVCPSGAADRRLKPIEADPFGNGLYDLNPVMAGAVQ